MHAVGPKKLSNLSPRAVVLCLVDVVHAYGDGSREKQGELGRCVEDITACMSRYYWFNQTREQLTWFETDLQPQNTSFWDDWIARGERHLVVRSLQRVSHYGVGRLFVLRGARDCVPAPDRRGILRRTLHCTNVIRCILCSICNRLSLTETLGACTCEAYLDA